MTRYVPGEGPQPCDLMFIGEGPGAEEDKYGRPFVGKSGRELTRYIWRALGRTRTSVYVTNLVKFRVPDDGDPTTADIERDRGTLDEEVKSVDPEIIVTLGRWSTRHFLGDVDMETVHGVPHMAGNRAVVPVIHPAAGLHNTEFQGQIAWDFEQLGKLVRGDAVAWAPEDEYPEPTYREGRDVDGTMDLAAVDTEGSAKDPWCLSYAIVPGRSDTILAKDVGDFQFCDEIVLHNALHDIGVLRALGVDITGIKFHDTMIQAYLLCVEPQGLKALAKRHCGMVMQDYSELVHDAREKHALDWLVKAIQWLNKQSIGESATYGRQPRTASTRTSGSAGRRSKRISPRKRPASRRR